MSFGEGLKQGPPGDERVTPVGQAGGVGQLETNLSGTFMKEREAIYIVWSEGYNTRGLIGASTSFGSRFQSTSGAST